MGFYLRSPRDQLIKRDAQAMTVAVLWWRKKADRGTSSSSRSRFSRDSNSFGIFLPGTRGRQRR